MQLGEIRVYLLAYFTSPRVPPDVRDYSASQQDQPRDADLGVGVGISEVAKSGAAKGKSMVVRAQATTEVESSPG